MVGLSLELKKKGGYGTCCPGKSDVNETLIMSRLVPVGNTNSIYDSWSNRGISDSQELVILLWFLGENGTYWYSYREIHCWMHNRSSKRH